MAEAGPPPKQGLYDPALEHDSCGFGFVADIKGRPSHDIVMKALEVLLNLEHRGATGAEKDTGDGAGILLQMPHAFLAREAGKLGIALPAPGRYGAGMVFLPPSEHGQEAIGKLFEETVRAEGQQLLGWNYLVHDPQPQRLLRVDEVAAPEQLERVRRPYQPRQEVSAAVAGDQPHPHVAL